MKTSCFNFLTLTMYFKVYTLFFAPCVTVVTQMTWLYLTFYSRQVMEPMRPNYNSNFGLYLAPSHKEPGSTSPHQSSSDQLDFLLESNGEQTASLPSTWAKPSSSRTSQSMVFIQSH